MAARKMSRNTALAGVCQLGAFVFVAALFDLGARPGAGTLVADPWDKVAHFAAFAVLAALVWLGDGGRRPLLVLVVAVVLGGLDELRQISLPGRTAAWGDFLTDALGALAAVAALRRAASVGPGNTAAVDTAERNGGQNHAL